MAQKTKPEWDYNISMQRYCEPETLRIMDATNSTGYPPSNWLEVDRIVCKLKHVKIVKRAKA